MTITYNVGSGLYVNMTNRCTNACEFCIRQNGEGAYGSEPLWLEREPSVEEVIADIEKNYTKSHTELVFCGYGEPTCRLFDMLSVCKSIKEKFPNIKIRLNTNGQSNLIYKKDTAPLFEGCFDAISISLNSATAEKYQEICHSEFGKEAFNSMLSFAEQVKNYVSEVAFSVVRGFLSDEDIKICQEIADKAGVTLRVREYIS